MWQPLQPFMHRGNGRAIAAWTDEHHSASEGRGMPLRSSLRCFSRRELGLTAWPPRPPILDAAATQLPCSRETLILLGQGPFSGLHELHQLQHPGLFMIRWFLFEGISLSMALYSMLSDPPSGAGGCP